MWSMWGGGQRRPPRWISRKGLAHFCRTKVGALSCPHKIIFVGGEDNAFCSFIFFESPDPCQDSLLISLEV